jgi:hypothetical protein
MTVNNAHTTEQNTVTRHKRGLKELLQNHTEDLEEFLKTDLENFAAFVTGHGISKPLVEIDNDDPPKYPKDPTSLSDTDLGKLYAEFVAWLAYCSYKLANAEAEVIYYTSVEDKSEKLLMEHYTSSIGFPEKQAKVAVERDAEMIFVTDCLTRAKAKKKSIEGIYAHYEHCSKGLSREISRRKGEETIFTGNIAGK